MSEIKDRPRRAPVALSLALTVAGGIILRARLAAEHAIYPYDAYYYLGGARSLANEFAYSFRGIPQTRYQPGYPIVVAPFTWLTSTDKAGVLVAVLAWGGVGIATYFIGKRAGGRWTGVVAAILVTFNPISIKWASVPMSESVFTLFLSFAVLALIAALQEKKPSLLVLSGALGGFSIITRVEGAVLLPLLAIGAFWMLSDCGWRKLRRILLPAGTAIVLFGIPFLIWYLRNRGIESKELAYSDELTYNLDVSGESAWHRLDYYLWSGQKFRPATLVAYAGMLAGIVRLKREIIIMAAWFGAMVAGHLIWYYVYERFLMGALPALAVSAAWISVALIRKLGRPRTAAAIAGCALLAAAVVVSIRTGVSFTHEHILGLNRDWGGETFVVVARRQRDLPGGSVSNRGAVFAFVAEQDTPYIFPVVADKDEIPHADPVQRARYLKNLGVERVVLATRGREPAVVLREVRLDGAGLILESTTTIDGPMEGTHQITAVYRLPD